MSYSTHIVYEPNSIYDKLHEDNIKVGDMIIYESNNQEGYGEYKVLEDDEGNKILKKIGDIYGTYDENYNLQGGNKKRKNNLLKRQSKKKRKTKTKTKKANQKKKSKLNKNKNKKRKTKKSRKNNKAVKRKNKTKRKNNK